MVKPENKNIDIIKYLVEKFNITADDLIQIDKYEETFIHRAAETGDVELMKYLMEDLKIDNNALTQRSIRNATPIHYAALSGSKKLMEYLIKERNIGADHLKMGSTENIGGYATPIDFAVSHYINNYNKEHSTEEMNKNKKTIIFMEAIILKDLLQKQNELSNEIDNALSKIIDRDYDFGQLTKQDLELLERITLQKDDDIYIPEFSLFIRETLIERQARANFFITTQYDSFWKDIDHSATNQDLALKTTEEHAHKKTKLNPNDEKARILPTDPAKIVASFAGSEDMYPISEDMYPIEETQDEDYYYSLAKTKEYKIEAMYRNDEEKRPPESIYVTEAAQKLDVTTPPPKSK